MKCENCGKEHDGSYGSGRFCSKSCKQQYNLKPKENKHYCCRFCGKEFGKPTSLAAYVSNCKLNPNSSRTKAKAAQTYSKNARKQNPLITITIKCCNCGKAFQQTITTKEHKRKAKHDAFPEIKYLRKADLKEQFKYVEETYGKNYVELLEASK